MRIHNVAIMAAVLLLPLWATAARPPYHSESRQDEWLHKNVFGNRRGGFFVEMGAYDGVFASNTCFFERMLGWKGICVEPLTYIFGKLCKNRTCLCVHGCVGVTSGEKTLVLAGCMSGLLSAMDPRHVQRIGGTQSRYKIRVRSYTFNELMRMNKVREIDYFSLDIEGGEFELLETIDWNRMKINVISVESNYPDLRVKIMAFMKSKGYVWMAQCGVDDLFRRADFVCTPLED